jgi:hypothetical protein
MTWYKLALKLFDFLGNLNYDYVALDLCAG